MKQSNVINLKRKFNMLFLHSSKLKSLQQLIKYRETSLSRTLYSLLSKRDKRFVSFNEKDDSSRKEKTKKRKIAREKEILRTSSYLVNFFSLKS